MTRGQRIWSVLTGAALLLLSVGMLLLKGNGYYLVLSILLLGLTVSGIRKIVYYLTMARHMVGGWRILFQGVITLNMGVFTLSLSSVSVQYVMLYLVGINLFNGLVNVLRGLEARRAQAPSWPVNLAAGITIIALSAAGLFYSGSMWIASALYCLTLAYTGVFRLAKGLRKAGM